MKNLKRMIVLLLTVMLFNVSCSSSDDDQQEFCEDYVVIIEQAIYDYSVVYQAYFTDPTAANCTAFKTEIQSLITTIEGFDQCILDSEKANYDELINELNEQLESACE